MGAGENVSSISDGFILSRMDPAEILNLAGEFVLQYYTVMRKCPSGLHRFYKDDSTMIHEDAPTFGQKLIHEKFMSMNLYNLRVGILHVDALRSSGNSVLIQVCGEISKNGSDYRRFMQSFVLSEQSPCDFYVLNDIFRYQDIVYGDAKSDSPRMEPEVERVALSHELQVDVRGNADAQQSQCQNKLGSEVNIETWKNPTYCKTTIEAAETIPDGHAPVEPEEHTLMPDPVNNMSTSPDSHGSSISPVVESPPVQIPPSQPLSWAQMASQKVTKPIGRVVHVPSQHSEDKSSARPQNQQLQGQVTSKFRGAGQRQHADDKTFGAGDHGHGQEQNARQGAPARISTGGRGGPRGGRVLGGRGGPMMSGGRMSNSVTAGGSMGPRRG